MKETSIVPSVLKSVIIALVTAIVTGVVLMLLSTAAAYQASDPAKLTTPFSFVTLALTSVICGITSARMCKDSDLPVQLTGAFAGSLLVLLIFILSFLPLNGTSNVSGGIRALVYCGVVCLSMLGAMLGKRRGKKRTKYTVKKRKARR